GPARAERGDVAHDQPRIARGERRVVEAQLPRQTGPEVRQYHVRAREQRVDDALGAWVLEVQGQGMLPAIARDEVPRLPGSQRREQTHGIALERFDLDHVRAAVGEELGAIGDRDELSELDDLDAREGLGARHGAHLTVLYG